MFAHGVEPLVEHAWTWADVLNNCLQESGIEAVVELCYGADVVGGPPGFAAQVFKFCDEFIQGVALHFDLQELLVSCQLLLTVGECVPEVPFEHSPYVTAQQAI